MCQLRRASICGHSAGPKTPLVGGCAIWVLQWTPKGQGALLTFTGGAEDWAVQDRQSGPGGPSLPLHYCFAYFIFYISTHFSHAQEHWGVTEGYASFSGHARIACMFPNLATHLPKSWLSVRPGCFMNCVFFWFPAEVSAMDVCNE